MKLLLNHILQNVKLEYDCIKYIYIYVRTLTTELEVLLKDLFFCLKITNLAKVQEMNLDAGHNDIPSPLTEIIAFYTIC
jgi:hypothetical protein